MQSLESNCLSFTWSPDLIFCHDAIQSLLLTPQNKHSHEQQGDTTEDLEQAETVPGLKTQSWHRGSEAYQKEARFQS